LIIMFLLRFGCISPFRIAPVLQYTSPRMS